MSSNVRRTRSKPAPVPDDFDVLYVELVRAMYEDNDPASARPIADRLERLLAGSPDHAESIRGEEVRSLLAELRGDLAEAARCREAEVRKILELHTRTVNTPHWGYVSRQYDFADVSDRLDLLAGLYDRQGDTARAVATLRESKRYCEARGIPFDGQEMLDEILGAAEAAV